VNTGESRETYLDYFSKHSSGDLSHCIEVAVDRQGPHVVVVGGTHGNEPAGVGAMVALYRQLQTGDIQLTRGKVSLLLGNPQAYDKDRRYLDRDLNRAFEDPETTTLEGRRAGDILEYLDGNTTISALLDLHSVSIGNFKICVYEKDSPASLDLTLRISDLALHFAYHPAHMPGTLIGAAGRRNITGLIVECGNHYSNQGTGTALAHLEALLRHYNLIEGSFTQARLESATITQYESIQAIKPGPHFKFLIDGVQTGTKVAGGQKFARDDHKIHVAPQDCFIVVPSLIVKPSDHDAGFLCKMHLFERYDLT
jgi:succinylglutamate desuccinylase